MLPMGRKGPAFMAPPGFNAVYRSRNQIATSPWLRAHLADRLAGAPAYDKRSRPSTRWK